MRSSVQIRLALLSFAAFGGCAQLIGAEFDGARLAEDASFADGSTEDAPFIPTPEASTSEAAVPDASLGFDARAPGEILFWVSADKGVIDGGAPEAGPDGAVLAAAWSDQSGRARDLAQQFIVKQPLFVPNAHNGLPVVRFERSRATCFSSSWLGLTGQAGITLFIVAKGSPTSLFRFQGGLVPQYLVFPWNARAYEPDASPDYSFLVATNTDSTRVRLPVDESKWQISVARLSVGKLAGMQVFRNGELIESASIAGDAGPTVDGFQVGCAPSQLAELADGDVGELIAYGAAISDVDRAAVERYLKDKWAVVY